MTDKIKAATNQLCELTKRWTAFEDIPRSQQIECRDIGRRLHAAGGGECAVGNAAGEIGGVLQRPQVDDPAAAALDFDYRCDCCDNGLQAEWDFCPYCGLCQREEPSGLCLAGIAANKACRPDDTLKRCTICGFIVDTQYAAEPPAKERRPRK